MPREEDIYDWNKALYYPYRRIFGSGSAICKGTADQITSRKLICFPPMVKIWIGGEVLGTHYVFEETNVNNHLSATVGNASQTNSLKIYYKCKLHTVTYEYDYSVPAGALPPAAEFNHHYSEENIKPTMPDTVSGYTFLWLDGKISERFDNKR